MINLQDHDLFGNKFCFEELYHWIEQKTGRKSAEGQKMDHQSCIVILGAPGIGKTYGVEKVCEILGIHIKKIDSTNCKSIKELSDLFVKMSSTNLQEILEQKTRKKIIFIDEFEILIQMDRNIPSILYQLIDTSVSGNKSLPYIPVVIACNDNMEKKLGDIRRYCKTIHLKHPTVADVLLMLRTYTQKNNMKISADVLLHIAENVAGNMLQALHTVQYELLKRENNEKIDTVNDADNQEDTDENEIMTNVMAIDSMPDINIMYNNPSRKIAYQLFEEDIWMNPLRFHENLSKEMELRKGTKQKKDQIYSKILRSILEWDIMIQNSDATYCYIDIAMDHLCNAPCYLLPQLERKKNVEDVSMSDFTKTLSQMSLQCKLKRHTYKDNFPWEHVGNYCYTIKKQKNKKFSDVDTDI